MSTERAVLPGLPEPGGPSKHCSIFVADIAGFGERDNDAQRLVHNALYAILRAAFNRSGVPWNACDHQDRGDAVLVTVPAQLPTALLADPLLPCLCTSLRSHNNLHCGDGRIRLRAALHAGQVQSDDKGLSGRAVVHVFRLLAADQLRGALTGSRADLAFLASDYVYREVLRYEGDRGVYQSVRIRVKETNDHAWLRVFKAAAPPATVGHRAFDDGGPWPSEN